jgi:hypothetical protein
MKKIIYSTALISALLFGCSGEQQTQFQGKSKKIAPMSDAASQTPPDSNGDDSNPNSNKVVTESFTYGKKVGIADFLFVIDNSCSMEKHIEKVLQGFGALSAQDYPPLSRLAVMTTMPADPNNLSKVHSEVSSYTYIEKEPGFLSLVNAANVSAYKQAGTRYGAAYPNPVCSESWFEPGSKTSNPQVSCLAGALQIVGHCTGAEAGLTALKQFFQKNAGKPIFRDGSYAHVVFVSDTHDPGKSADKAPLLTALRPTFAAIKNAAFENSKLADLKLHGVVPATQCGETFTSPSYIDAILASKGTKVDLCTTTDYTPIARQIVNASVPQPIFAVKNEIAKVESVLVNGKAISSFSVERGNIVRVEGIESETEASIQIRYTAK